MPRDPLSYPPAGWSVWRNGWRCWWLQEDTVPSPLIGPFKSRSAASYEARFIIAKRRIEVGGDS